MHGCSHFSSYTTQTGSCSGYYIVTESVQCNTCSGKGNIPNKCTHQSVNSHRYCGHYENTTIIQHD